MFDTLIKLMHLPIIGPVAFGVNKGVNFVAVQCRTLNMLFFIHITFRKQTSLQHTYSMFAYFIGGVYTAGTSIADF